MEDTIKPEKYREHLREEKKLKRKPKRCMDCFEKSKYQQMLKIYLSCILTAVIRT